MMKFQIFFNIYPWTIENKVPTPYVTLTPRPLVDKDGRQYSATIYIKDELLPGAGTYLGEIHAEEEE